MAGASGEASPNTDPPQPPAIEPAAAGASPPLADPPLADPPAAEPPAVRRHTLSDAQLEDRLNRARGAHVRNIGADYGIENDDQMRAVLERDRAAQAKAETDRQASMTREQQLQEELATSQAARAEAEEAAEMAGFQALIHQTCSAMGIRNTTYAEHMVLDAAVRSTDEEFDEKAYLQRLLEDPAQASALGIVATESTGATTVPGHGQNDPPSTEPAKPPGATNAMDMTREEYAEYRKNLRGGISEGNAFG